MEVEVRYATEFGSSATVINVTEIPNFTKRFKILSVNPHSEPKDEIKELLDLVERGVSEINHIKFTYKDKGHCVKYLSDCEAIIERLKKK
jgi:hypothetical protein